VSFVSKRAMVEDDRLYVFGDLEAAGRTGPEDASTGHKGAALRSWWARVLAARTSSVRVSMS
jgi:hypothetical protein